MSTHNICFCGIIRKLFCRYPNLSRPMISDSSWCWFTLVLADNILKASGYPSKGDNSDLKYLLPFSKRSMSWRICFLL